VLLHRQCWLMIIKLWWIVDGESEIDWSKKFFFNFVSFFCQDVGHIITKHWWIKPVVLCIQFGKRNSFERKNVEFNSMFSCDTKKFTISRSQRKIVQSMNRFINLNIKPDQKTSNTQVNPPMTVRQWIETPKTTRAKQLTQHLLTQNTRMKRKISWEKEKIIIFSFEYQVPSDDLVKYLPSRQKRWYKKLLKLKNANKLSFDTGLLKFSILATITTKKVSFRKMWVS